jgi:uncharacterized membrane protein (UPF0127 family)
MKEIIKGSEVFSRLMILKLALVFILCLFLIRAHAAENPKKICFKDTCVLIEIADTDSTRTRGLMFRDHLDQDKGMLFIFPSEDIYPFWMKNTLIDLDMIWLDKDLNVVEVKSFVPACKQFDCPSYIPKANAKFVLELNAGYADFHNIKVNDKAYLKND